MRLISKTQKYYLLQDMHQIAKFFTIVEEIMGGRDASEPGGIPSDRTPPPFVVDLQHRQKKKPVFLLKEH